MGCELIGHDSLTDVIALGEAEVLLLRDVAEHGGTLMSDDRGTDSPRDVVVASTDVGDQRAEGIEGGFIAVEEFACHVLGDEVHGDVPRAFDHHLHMVASGDAIEFAESLQLCELCCIVGVMDAAWTQAIAEGEGDVVAGSYLTDLLEVGVEEALLVVLGAPARHDRPTTADDTCKALEGQRDVLLA